MNKFFPRIFYRLSFEVLVPVTNLEYYQGIYWSAMLRHWSRPYFKAPLSELGISPVPVHNGLRNYYPGEIVALDISLPLQHQKELLNMLADELESQAKAPLPEGHLHFYPGKSLRLMGYESLCDSAGSSIIDLTLIMEKTHCLRELNTSLDLIFHTPLRLKPNKEDRQRFRYLDPLGFSAQSFLRALCQEFNLGTGDFPTQENQGLIWLDVPYEKTLGGVIGGIRLGLPQDNKLLAALVAGQYCGIGKNRSFGFGFFGL